MYDVCSRSPPENGSFSKALCASYFAGKGGAEIGFFSRVRSARGFMADAAAKLFFEREKSKEYTSTKKRRP